MRHNCGKWVLIILVLAFTHLTNSVISMENSKDYKKKRMNSKLLGCLWIKKFWVTANSRNQSHSFGEKTIIKGHILFVGERSVVDDLVNENLPPTSL